MRNFILFAALFVFATTSSACTQTAGAAKGEGLSAALKQGAKYPVFWPPRAGEKYPDLHLTDSNGKEVNLSKYEGKVVLIEELAMSCAACNAFVGANRPGKTAFPGAGAQQGIPAIDDYLDSSGVDIHSPNFVKIDLIIYNLQNNAPSLSEVRDWCKHYNITESANRVVLFGDQSLICPASYEMIPGFHLLAANMVVVSDSSGHAPKDDLWKGLIPQLKAMVPKRG